MRRGRGTLLGWLALALALTSLPVFAHKESDAYLNLRTDAIDHHRLHGQWDIALRDLDVDTLVLGCTHYPLLTGVLSYVMGDEVTLVSSAEETAKDVYALLVREGLERDPSHGLPAHKFLTTGRPEEFAELGRRFLGPELRTVDQFAWVSV